MECEVLNHNIGIHGQSSANQGKIDDLSRYCGIIRFHGDSIFIVFVGIYSPPPQIYILNENEFSKSYIC